MENGHGVACLVCGRLDAVLHFLSLKGSRYECRDCGQFEVSGIALSDLADMSVDLRRKILQAARTADPGRSVPRITLGLVQSSLGFSSG